MYCSQCGRSLNNGARFCSDCGSARDGSPVEQASEGSSTRTATVWLLLVGGGLTIVGSLLPWLTASTVFGTMQRGALDGDGLVTLAAGVVLSACGVAGLLKASPKPLLVVGLLAGLVAGSVLAYDGTRILRLLESINSDRDSVARAEVGIGLVVLALGLLCSVVGLAMCAWLVGSAGRADKRDRVPAAVLPVLAVALVSLALVGSGAVAANEPLDRDEPERDSAEASSSAPLASPTESPSDGPTASAPSADPKSPAPPSPVEARPAATGTGLPDCNGSCTVDHRLTRSFLPQYSGEQTLLLASSEESDDDGNMLHAFLVDDAGRVLWEEHGFGWMWQPVDERFAIRFDEAGHVFFRSYVADFTYLYVLDTATGQPRLVGSANAPATDGFQSGEVINRAGDESFWVRETLLRCPAEGDPNLLDCPSEEVLYRWSGSQYVPA